MVSLGTFWTKKLRIGGLKALVFLKNLTKDIEALFKGDYLRYKNKEEMNKLLQSAFFWILVDDWKNGLL